MPTRLSRGPAAAVRIIAFAMLLGGGAACGDGDLKRSPSAAGTTQGVAGEPLRIDTSRRTTDAQIVLTNLDAALAHCERLLEKGDKRAAVHQDRVGAAMDRFGVSGNLADLDRATESATFLAQEAPEGRGVALAIARLAAARHRFDDALTWLEKAQAAGDNDLAVRSSRAAVWQALGELEPACLMFETLVEQDLSVRHLAQLAACRGAQGHYQLADDLFWQAEQQYRDVSPLVLVSLWFERGKMWEQAGDVPKARALYAAAAQRMPQHAHAVAHWANYLVPAEARVALETALQSSDDPDLMVGLADLERERDATRADALLRAAERGYKERLTRHPEAYADHAAWYLLHQNRPAEARHWAQFNLALRPTSEAYELALSAGLQGSFDPLLCDVARQAPLYAPLTPGLSEQLDQASSRCNP